MRTRSCARLAGVFELWWRHSLSALGSVVDMSDERTDLCSRLKVRCTPIEANPSSCRTESSMYSLQSLHEQESLTF